MTFYSHSTGVFEATEDINSGPQTSPTQLFKYELWTLNGKSWFSADLKYATVFDNIWVWQYPIQNHKLQYSDTAKTYCVKLHNVWFLAGLLYWISLNVLVHFVALVGHQVSLSQSWSSLHLSAVTDYITWAAASVSFDMNAFMSNRFFLLVLWIRKY